MLTNRNNCLMKKFILFVCLLTSTNCVVGQVLWENGNLVVSDNSRYLQHTNGKPFFWLGDTGWLICQKLDRDEIRMYFKNRKGKGFNVVQCIVLQNLNDINVYGDSSTINNDITRLNITPGSDPADPKQYDY